MTKKNYKFDPDQVWFISDTHFGHENIIRFCGRPFRDVEEMNAELIRRWRKTCLMTALSSIWVISPMADRAFGMT